MAASTIPNSGGPGSPVELSPVTIAVRDKVIEKFTGQPLDEMNNSLKALLSKEEDEQKRLGILAARVYILRQRILSIAEDDADRVLTTNSPRLKDLASEEHSDPGDMETAASEWTRLRILEDCEVNGVRFPKTVIIDVKNADAERLLQNGKAEMIDESESAPEPSEPDADPASEVSINSVAEDDTQNENSTPAADHPEDTLTEQNAEAADPSAMLEALSGESATADDVASDEATDEPNFAEQSDSEPSEAVIEAPSAAEVTAALEALGAGAAENATDSKSDEAADDNAAESDAADVASELAALSAVSDASNESNEESEDAAEVAAALEAASAAIAAGPSNTDISDLPTAGAEQDDDEQIGDSEKPAGWFEAQQNAEASKRNEDKTDDENT